MSEEQTDRQPSPTPGEVDETGESQAPQPEGEEGQAAEEQVQDESAETAEPPAEGEPTAQTEDGVVEQVEPENTERNSPVGEEGTGTEEKNTGGEEVEERNAGGEEVEENQEPEQQEAAQDVSQEAADTTQEQQEAAQDVSQEAADTTQGETSQETTEEQNAQQTEKQSDEMPAGQETEPPAGSEPDVLKVEHEESPEMVAREETPKLETPVPGAPPPPSRQPTDSFGRAAEASPTPVQIQQHVATPPASASHQSPRVTPSDKRNTTPRIPTPPPNELYQGPGQVVEVQEEKISPNALNMSWSFGLNKHVPLLNLTDESRQMVAYACAHTCVLYEFRTNRQTLLQGHGNAISCTCSSEDRRWLATADKGIDNIIIVWDTYTGIPVRTLFDPHPDGGVAAIAMTPDAKYIATLSAADTQTLAIWDWTVEGDTPLCTAELDPSYGVQSYILFNPDDTSQMVTNSDHQVLFYSWKPGKLEYFAPSLTDEDFNKPVGKYSQSIFQANSTRALTATSLGNLVVWDTSKSLTKMSGDKVAPDKKALKLVKLQDRALSVITTSDKYIVTGDILGHIKFFDQTLKLTNWYHDFHLGPVNSVSFAYWPNFQPYSSKSSSYPPDATIAARQFVLKDFVVGTSTAVYASITTDGTDIKVIHRDHDAAVHAISAHPSESRLCVGSYSGLLKIWDYQTKKVLASRWFDKGHLIRCCQFDPKGQYLAVGFTNGILRVLDTMSLEDVTKEPFRYARDAITHLAFSHDSNFLATADAEYTVTLFRAHSSRQGGEPWIYIGRHRAHYKLICDLIFGIQLDSNQPKLMSLSEDRHLVEYDLEGSSRDDLRILSSDRIEQSAIPMCMACYPPVTKESFIVTANDQFKFKLYNSTTKMCRKTLLGPTYGSAIQQISILPSIDPHAQRRYLVYITADKIGLHILPLDGNPHNSMALIAHPQGVANLACSHDGKYVFTAGGVDASVHMWDVNVMALEAQSKLGGEDLIPFYGLMDGGREGELFKELEDYFYYAQIRSQGVDTTEERKISTKIPVSEIPFVMRAMGFYPTEQEVEDMLNEIKFSNYVETGQYTTDIDLGGFIRLYINHRPAFGLQPDKLAWAFEVLGASSEDGYAIERGDLLEILQSRGEHMTEYELAEYLTTLLGFTEEGGSSELQDFDTSNAGDIIEDNLPQEITATMFADDLLGFGMYADQMEDDVKDRHLQTPVSEQAVQLTL